jgi:endonuclease/exonuclease/phosphatase family metal-dependent hydrolase
MAPFRILFSNLGYARHIDGSLRQHVRGLARHVSCAHDIQQGALEQLRTLMHAHQVDLACLAEIDAGSSNNRYFDQMHFLRDGTYAYAHATNKYGTGRGLDTAALSRGKSNGWLARAPVHFECRYLSEGTKRLVYALYPEGCPPILFGHFSLRAPTRRAQFAEVAAWLPEVGEDVIVLGDFNNYRGLGELSPLMEGGGLNLVGGGREATFKFARYRAAVDLCLASERLLSGLHVRVLPQSFSDHEALLIEWRPLA